MIRYHDLYHIMSEYAALRAGLKEQLGEIERLYLGVSYNAKVEEFRDTEYPQLNGI